MAGLCSDSVLTGQDGLIQFKPAGTSVCVSDYCPFDNASGRIYLPCGTDFRVGDCVTFSEEDGASLDSGLTAGTEYNISEIGVGASGDLDACGADMEGYSYIILEGVTLSGSGGTGSEDTPSPAHINITLCDYMTTCNVRSFSVDFSRDELDVTTLPCEATGCDSLAQFRKTQAGYATASGSLEVYFTCDQETLSNRLLGSSLLKTQTGAAVKLYVCTEYDADGTPVDDKSLFIEAEISLLGMSFSVNPDDTTTATINFGVTRMIQAFGQTA